VSDAHARLRQYLEQRRELGETEFVLDSLSVDEAMKVLTQKGTPPPVDLRAAVEPPAPRLREPRAVAPSADQAPPAAPRSMPATAAVPDSEPPLTDLSAARTIADIAAAVAKCTACSLSASALNHVPGEGNPAAKFVVVGEAPGATEDELGRPFVGKSGDLLTKILEAIGLKREEVFICNVLKHRPPGNRNPTPAEIRACSPFLLRQLEVLQPKVILALGTFAAQTLLGTDAAISKLRGIEHRYHGIPLVATYHPAALLRNPNWKRPTWEDVQLARRILDRA
jgi:uracil-DNA glycosylase family 4